MIRKQQVWIIDDDRSIRWVLEKALQKAGLEVVSFESGNRALEALARDEPAVIVSDIRMPGIDGLELLSHINQIYPHLPVIITTAHSDLDSAVESYQRGAYEYLPKNKIDVVYNGIKPLSVDINEVNQLKTQLMLQT